MTSERSGKHKRPVLDRATSVVVLRPSFFSVWPNRVRNSFVFFVFDAMSHSRAFSATEEAEERIEEVPNEDRPSEGSWGSWGWGFASSVVSKTSELSMHYFVVDWSRI